jgi:hypothetical protein
MDEADIQILHTESFWRSRRVTRWSGSWEQLSGLIPDFETRDFRAADGKDENQYLQTVVRLPRTLLETPIPVGVVSHSYVLAPHREVAELCFKGVREAGIETHQLQCGLGLSELSEWMNLRISLPDEYDHTPRDGEKLQLRLECFNTVEGSSRLMIFLGWFRFVCSNGMTFGETKVERRDVHRRGMNIQLIPEIISEALGEIRRDTDRLRSWEGATVRRRDLMSWANKHVSEKWGKKAACRVFHICSCGFDVEITDPFAGGNATEKPTRRVARVPGAPETTRHLYDVSQSLAWVATRRRNVEERLKWQAEIPRLVEHLRSTRSGPD